MKIRKSFSLSFFFLLQILSIENILQDVYELFPFNMKDLSGNEKIS